MNQSKKHKPGDKSQSCPKDIGGFPSLSRAFLFGDGGGKTLHKVEVGFDCPGPTKRFDLHPQINNIERETL